MQCKYCKLYRTLKTHYAVKCFYFSKATVAAIVLSHLRFKPFCWPTVLFTFYYALNMKLVNAATEMLLFLDNISTPADSSSGSWDSAWCSPCITKRGRGLLGHVASEGPDVAMQSSKLPDFQTSALAGAAVTPAHFTLLCELNYSME